MRIYCQQLLRELGTNLSLPRTRPRQEETLSSGVTLDDGGIGGVVDAILLQFQQIGFPRNVETAQIPDVFPDG